MVLWNQELGKWQWDTHDHIPQHAKDALRKERALSLIRHHAFSALQYSPAAKGEEDAAAAGGGSARNSGPLGGHFGHQACSQEAGSQGEQDATAAGGGSASGSRAETAGAVVMDIDTTPLPPNAAVTTFQGGSDVAASQSQDVVSETPDDSLIATQAAIKPGSRRW
jgi:hypothetical protein